MTYNFSQFKNEAKKAEEWLGKEYSSIHSGRATPHVLDGVLVESYGTKTPISHVASISVEDPKSLMVSPWDKNLMKDIERSIQASNLGLSVSSQANGVRVSFPELTIERKKTLIKVIKDKLEDSRVSVRGREKKSGMIFKPKNETAKCPKMTNSNSKTNCKKLLTRPTSVWKKWPKEKKKK